MKKCSFCGKSQEQVKKLIAGYDAYICNECVDLCNQLLLNVQISEIVKSVTKEILNEVNK